MTFSHPKTFIAYAWEDDAHNAWVLELGTSLRADGVDASLDQWEIKPGDSLTSFMEKVREAEFVLIVCTPKYRDKANVRSGGVGYETNIMTAELAAEAKQGKFIPILRRGDDRTALPTWLQGKSYLDFRRDTTLKAQYEKLLRTLYGRLERAPPLGPVPSFAEAPQRGRLAAMKRLLQNEWLPVLRNREEQGLPLDGAVQALFNTVARMLGATPYWLDIIERFAADSTLSPKLLPDEEFAIRELRNMGLLSHDGKWLLTPTRSKNVRPTEAGAILVALGGHGGSAPHQLAREFTSKLLKVAQPRLDLLAKIHKTGEIAVQEKQGARLLRNCGLVFQSEYFLASTKRLTVTELGDSLLKWSEMQRSRRPTTR